MNALFFSRKQLWIGSVRVACALSRLGVGLAVLLVLGVTAMAARAQTFECDYSNVNIGGDTGWYSCPGMDFSDQSRLYTLSGFPAGGYMVQVCSANSSTLHGCGIFYTDNGGNITFGDIYAASGDSWLHFSHGSDTSMRSDSPIYGTTGGSGLGQALDTGSWPTQGHDDQRTNRSSLVGPSTPGTPKLLFDAGSPVQLGNSIIVTSENEIVMSSCSTNVFAVNTSGKALWTYPLDGTYNESAYGLTASAGGVIRVSVNDCPDIPGGQPMHFYSVNPDGTPYWPTPPYQSGMYGSPTIASDGTIYQGDEFATIRAYRPTDGLILWSYHVCCYANRSVALDSNGNLYIATDGGAFGSSSLWSLTPGGSARWSTGTGNLTGAAIGPGDVIYTLSSTGTLFCYRAADGSECWPGVSLGGTPSGDNPLAVSSGGIVYAKTSLGLFAINPDGTRAWSSPFSPGGDASLSPNAVVDSDGSIYVAFGDQVYSLDANGNIRSGWPVAVPSAGPLVIGGKGILYVVSAGQKLYSIGGGAETLGELAAQQAEKLEGGSYGEGGKGFDYSGLSNLRVIGSPNNPSSQNPCEVHGLSSSTDVAPCWITPEGINDTTTGYAYYASNTGNPAPNGGSANATDCVGLGSTPCLDLKNQPENPPVQLHYDFGLDCSGLIMWSYMTAADATGQEPIIKYEGAGVAGDLIQSITRSSNIVTVSTRAANSLAKGNAVRIEGVADSSFDGSFTVSSTPSPNEFTYAQVGSDSSSSWGVATKVVSGTTYPQGQCNDEQSALLSNNLGDISQAATYKAPPGILPGDLMCFRYYYKGKVVSGHVGMVVGNGSTVEALNRTSNIVSGHVNSNGAGLGRAFRDPVGVMNCLLPHGSYCFDFLGYRRPTKTQAAILFQMHSPVSLSVTDPGGFTIDRNSWVTTEHEAYRAAGSLSYDDYSTNGDDTVFSPILEPGPYTVRAVPKPNAAPDATYTLTVTVGSNTIPLAQNVPISEIPPLGYGVLSDGTNITPFTPVAIDIKPGASPASINSRSNGTTPVAILSNAQFDAPSQIDPSSLKFGRTGTEASLARCDSNGEDVNGDGLPDLVCHFYTQSTGFQNGDTQGILTGLTVSGGLIRGAGAVIIVPR